MLIGWSGKGGWAMWRRGGNCCIAVMAVALGAGILIACIFPVGFLTVLVALLLIACGIALLRDRR